MKTISIVTGGSSGLGYAIAERLVQQDEAVLIIGRNSKKLNNAKNLLASKSNADVLDFCGDITDEEFVSGIYSNLEDNGYYTSKLYNCAGVGRFGEPEENTLEMLNDAIGASLVGLILMSTYALKSMNNGGIIINIMSTAALKGNAKETVYCAAKWGARGYTEALKAAKKGTNIKVIGVYPGGMKTPFWSEKCGLSPNIQSFMDPSEVAEQIIFTTNSKNTLSISDITIDRK